MVVVVSLIPTGGNFIFCWFRNPLMSALQKKKKARNVRSVLFRTTREWCVDTGGISPVQTLGLIDNYSGDPGASTLKVRPQTYYFAILYENCMEMKEIGPKGGRPGVIHLIRQLIKCTHTLCVSSWGRPWGVGGGVTSILFCAPVSFPILTSQAAVHPEWN